MADLILHEDPISANCYKIQLTAALLSVPLERRAYSILKGETRTPEFLNNISSFGRIPVLQVGPSHFIPESNAACFFLADSAQASPSSQTPSRPRLIPDDLLQRADMMRWLFFEQNQLEINIAVLRYWLHILGKGTLSDERLAQLGTKRNAGIQILDCMEDHLSKSLSGWFVGDGITLADICLFAYTHVAYDSGFDLDNWPAVKQWCEKVKKEDNFVEMDAGA